MYWLLEVQDIGSRRTAKDTGHHVLVRTIFATSRSVPDGLLIEGELTDTATLTRFSPNMGLNDDALCRICVGK